MAGGPRRILGPDQKYPAPLLLRPWRDFRALTQQELADRAGVSRRTVAAIEAGEVRPHPATIRALAAALKAKPEQLRAPPRPTPVIG